jgi:GntR family transcriptional regulator
MDLSIDAASHTPIYQQVTEQVRALVASGRLPAGERLPSVRGLAERLLINPNTVARAYRELEASGLVTTRRRVGTIVQAAPAPAGPELRQQAVAFVGDARRAGLSDDAVIDLVRGALLG